MEVLSTAIHRKNHVYQQCTSYASVVRKSVRNTFSCNMETLILKKKIPSLSTLGIPNGDIKLSKLWEKLNLWGKATVDKSDWIKAWHKKRLLLVTITLITLRKTYSITLCQVVKLTWMFLEVQQ